MVVIIMYEIYAWNTHEYAKRKIGETYKKEERESIMTGKKINKPSRSGW